MMVNINLLPWREYDRTQAKKRFLVMLVAVMSVTLLSIMIYDDFIEKSIVKQQQRNDYLQQHIITFEQKIKEISFIKKIAQALILRMQSIDSLQSAQQQTASLFCQITTAIPHNVRLNSLIRKEDVLILSGLTTSNAKLSALMHHIDSLPLFTDSRLMTIKPQMSNHTKYYQFSLQFSLNKPQKSFQQLPEA